MKKTKTKRLSCEETADRLTDIVGGFLSKLPADERKKRLASAHTYIQSRISAVERDIRSTPEERDCTPPTRVAARSAR